ncbi:hypothetical protein E2C01_035572 [Portunus trituberculatus]|uniref:Uncharacterized protein n=1 Tax=Portunus trituberculatus TaxID=210409 RepID=A0A5B7F4J3_PORTR|nr:hypothetical protein [Portunus trituberculatus]
MCRKDKTMLASPCNIRISMHRLQFASPACVYQRQLHITTSSEARKQNRAVSEAVPAVPAPNNNKQCEARWPPRHLPYPFPPLPHTDQAQAETPPCSVRLLEEYCKN